MVDVKYHYLYLHALERRSDLRNGLKIWLRFYNEERLRYSLNDKSPDEVYDNLPLSKIA